MKKFNIFFSILLAATLLYAGASRIVQVDQFKSSDLTKTWNLPSISDTLAGVSATQTLENKTLSSPTINGGTASGTIVNFADAFGGTYRNIAISGTSTISNTLTNNGTITGGNITATTILSSSVSDTTIVAKDSTTTFVDNTTPSKKWQFEGSSISPNTTRSISIPDDNFVMASVSSTQTFTNKTLTSPIINSASITNGTASGTTLNNPTINVRDNVFTLQDNSDASKEARFELSGFTTGNTRTFTLPDNSGTVATLNQAQTFSASQTFTVGITLTNGQVVFPSSQVPSANANTLDDFEKGTFTPTFIGGAAAGTTTYTTQSGKYVKVGQWVWFVIRVAWSAATGTGNSRFCGLPFTTNGTGFNAAHYSYFENYTFTAANIPEMYLIPGDTCATAYQIPSGGGASSNINVDGAADVLWWGYYQTN